MSIAPGAWQRSETLGLRKKPAHAQAIPLRRVTYMENVKGNQMTTPKRLPIDAYRAIWALAKELRRVRDKSHASAKCKQNVSLALDRYRDVIKEAQIATYTDNENNEKA